MIRLLIFCTFLLAAPFAAQASNHGGASAGTPVKHWEHPVWANYATPIMRALHLPNPPPLGPALRDAEHPQHRQAHMWAEQVASAYRAGWDNLPRELTAEIDRALGLAAIDGELCRYSDTVVTTTDRHEPDHQPHRPTLLLLFAALGLFTAGRLLLARRLGYSKLGLLTAR